MELEKISLKCDIGSNNAKFVSPSQINKVSETPSVRKQVDIFMHPETRPLFQHLSPSMLSSFIPEDGNVDQALVRRV